MARAFVIRPFGKKKDSAGQEFDFDAAHATVIGPALIDAGLAGSTTGEIIDAGNIREDMFSLILEADLVICDVTLLNANVFYELGIRHALRRKCTLLIKQSGSADSPPFDLLTDRYLAFTLTDPEAKAKLVQAIQATLLSDRSTDSPIFSMLPDLPEADPSVAQVVPLDFRQEVGRARAASSKGWLRLLGQDVRGRRFERPGLQLVASGQWDLKDYVGTRESLEVITAIQPDNAAANLVLANVYERLYRDDKRPELLARSDQAVEHVLAGRDVSRADQVEALALEGRNQKTRWRLPFDDLSSVEERRSAGMNEPLRKCFDAYRKAFNKDLNHFWSGLAALQMGAIFLDLSEGNDTWKSTFDDDAKADAYREGLVQDVATLRYAVSASVDAALARLPTGHPDRIWAEVSKVDVLFLTDQSDQRVVNRYRDTIPRDKPFVWDAARGQLQLFADLGVRAGRSAKVIEECDRKFTGVPAKAPLHVVLFAGHRIDGPGRTQPRFPAERVDRAKTLIRGELAKLVSDAWETLGFASAAPGGDLLFHEACDELAVRSIPCLPMPADKYSGQTFRDLDEWRSRFLALLDRNRERKQDVLELSDQEGLPRWLHGTSVNPWERGNRWVLQMALASGAKRITLLALWDGAPAGDDVGGTAQMVQLARDAGVIDVKVINSRDLL
jgi:tetratricopeptide repeat protein